MSSESLYDSLIRWIYPVTVLSRRNPEGGCGMRLGNTERRLRVPTAKLTETDLAHHSRKVCRGRADIRVRRILHLDCSSSSYVLVISLPALCALPVE